MATEDAGDVDPEQLQAQLSRIQEAMGIDERYESAMELWLVFGVLVALASLASQYVYTNDLGGYLYAVIWLGGLGGGSLAYGRLRGRSLSRGDGEGSPDVFVIVGVVYAAAFPILALAGVYLEGMTTREWSLLSLSVIVVLLGVAYVVVGNALEAHYIRARDRYAFYVGGVLLIGVGMVLPTFPRYPYLVFGGTYLAYAVAAYSYLSR